MLITPEPGIRSTIKIWNKKRGVFSFWGSPFKDFTLFSCAIYLVPILLYRNIGCPRVVALTDGLPLAGPSSDVIDSCLSCIYKVWWVFSCLWFCHHCLSSLLKVNRFFYQRSVLQFVYLAQTFYPDITCLFGRDNFAKILISGPDKLNNRQEYLALTNYVPVLQIFVWARYMYLHISGHASGPGYILIKLSESRLKNQLYFFCIVFT